MPPSTMGRPSGSVSIVEYQRSSAVRRPVSAVRLVSGEYSPENSELLPLRSFSM